MIRHRLHSGFTLVEVLVVVVVITILAIITTVSYNSLQANSRDGERESKAHIIASALETYYTKHGEYPSTAFITQNTASAIQQKLRIKDARVLVMPGAPDSTTNSLTPATSSPTELAYNGQSVNENEETQCEAPTTAEGGELNGGCDSFQLQWTTEGGEELSIQSVHQTRPASAPPAAPDDPTITIATSGTSLTATATTGDCSTGQLEYKLAVNTTGNEPDWSTVTWSTTNTKTVSSAVAGTQYYFYAITRCVNESGNDAVSNTTEKDIFYSPAGTPTTTAQFSSTNAVASVTANPGCTTGTTAKYYIEYRVDTPSAQGAWTVGNNWSTSASYTYANATSSPPRSINFRAKVRCDSSTGTGTASPTSAVASVITAPAAPTVSIASSTNKDAKTWQWTAASCPQGTTAKYLYTRYVDNGTNWSPWPADSASITTRSVAIPTNYQGYDYRVKVKARCTVGSYNSAWGGESNAPSYIRAVEAPGTASNFSFTRRNYTNSSGYKQQYADYYWKIPTCGLGTSPVFEYFWYEETKRRSDNTLIERGFSYTTPDGIFSGDEYTLWPSGSTTTANLQAYYRIASYVNASDVPTWRAWVPTSSNPITLSTAVGNTNVYFSKMRLEVRYACLNTTTKRYAIGPPTLSGIKTWISSTQ